jgi:hypothetical protein
MIPPICQRKAYTARRAETSPKIRQFRVGVHDECA